jgi:hypothetical protein
MQNELTEDQNNLKLHGEKIIIDLDHCDIKENNYYEEIASKIILPAQADDYREHYIVQSVIIYTFNGNGSSEKFVSQTFPVDTITLESHILNNEIILYVDALDRGKYFFDFNPVP